MGIALYHEVKPARGSSPSPRARGEGRDEGRLERSTWTSPLTRIASASDLSPHSGEGEGDRPRKPTLDEMGPGVEAIPARGANSPRSKMGRPGMRGGFKKR